MGYTVYVTDMNGQRVAMLLGAFAFGIVVLLGDLVVGLLSWRWTLRSRLVATSCEVLG